MDPLASGDESGSGEEGKSLGRQAKLTKNHRDKLLKKNKKAKEPAKDVYLIDEDEDPYFVLMCLLSDLREMRDHVKEI